MDKEYVNVVSCVIAAFGIRFPIAYHYITKGRPNYSAICEFLTTFHENFTPVVSIDAILSILSTSLLFFFFFFFFFFFKNIKLKKKKKKNKKKKKKFKKKKKKYDITLKLMNPNILYSSKLQIKIE